jgi:DedD protein
MGLLDFLQRDRSGATPAAAANGEQAEQARARAKRRLIGAVVLLGIGVIAFPLLFETQPRPIPVDIPIQIPSRESAAPLVLPPTRPSPAASLPAAAPAPAPKAAATPAVPAPAAVEPARVEPAPAPKATPAKAEPALPAPPKTAEAPGRFVVQVGAFAEASAVREARAKVEKLGLVTYTQQVETASGPRTRVRLGPFATREEADQAAAKVKAAGLPGAVLAL